MQRSLVGQRPAARGASAQQASQRYHNAACHALQSFPLPRAATVARHRAPLLTCRSAPNDLDSKLGLDPMLEAAVPRDQRPVNELKQIQETFLISWGNLELGEYVKRLAVVWALFFATIGGPISYQTFDPASQTLLWALSASTGALLVVAAVVVRVYLAWDYVGGRLLSATVDYEETGWYDGQTFVKPPEVLMRDRLLGMYQVKPVLAKLRTTLLGSGAILAVSAIALFGLINADTDADGVYGRGAARTPRQVTADGVIYSSRVTSLSQLATDDEAAAEEAAAQGGIPGYCSDPVLRANAGGSMCAKFETSGRHL